jgi:hypothetical protein
VTTCSRETPIRQAARAEIDDLLVVARSALRDVRARDGKAAEAHFREPFDILFSSRRFEYGDLAGKTLPYSNYQTTRSRLAELSAAIS